MAGVLDERPERRKWTRQEYERAGEMGLFGPEERLELVDGAVMEHARPQSPGHAQATTLCAMVLRGLLRGALHVQDQKPLAVSDTSEPEPDVAVIRGAPRDYANHPSGADCVLVVEVADSTLGYDQGTKGSLYARAGIPEYWVLDLRHRRLEVRRDPGETGGGEYGYRTIQLVAEHGTASPLAAPEAVIAVADVLPGRGSGTAEEA